MVIHSGRWTSGWRTRAAVGLLLVIGFGVQCQKVSAGKPAAAEAGAARPKVDPGAAYASIKPQTPVADPFEAMVKTDPLAFFRGALERYERSVHDYVCTFEKQEMVGGRLQTEQVTQVRFREKPFSVNMLWTRNADKARRVIYVDGKWTDNKGQRLAIVEPEGVIARALVDYVMRPIDGSDAKKAARRQIDQFGFANSMRLIIKYSEMAAQRKELAFRFVGEGTSGNRPTWVLERTLPYTDDAGVYPDRVLVVHVDKEWFVPVCCISYADDARTKLLGKYVTRDVRFNVGLTDADFTRPGAP